MPHAFGATHVDVTQVRVRTKARGGTVVANARRRHETSLADPQIARAILLIGAIGLTYLNWRCPACDAFLGRKSYPRHCHDCGVSLRE